MIQQATRKPNKDVTERHAKALIQLVEGTLKENNMESMIIPFWMEKKGFPEKYGEIRLVCGTPCYGALNEENYQNYLH